MNEKHIFQAIGNVGSDLVSESEGYSHIKNKKRKQQMILKFGSMAACLALICVTVFALIPLMNVSASDFEIEDGVLIAYTGNDKEVEIPLSVTTIADYAFAESKNVDKIESIVLTTNVQKVENLAFYGCENLQTLSLSEDNRHFQDNNGMILSSDGSTLIYVNSSVGTTLNIPETVTSIQSCAVRYSNIHELTLPSSVKTLENYSVIFNDKLESVILNGVTEIGENAFYNNISLKSISAPYAQKIEENAFAGCTSLKTVHLPLVKSVGKNAFSNCSSLETIEMNAAIEIMDGAFSNCKKLFSVDLPSVVTIGNHAFYSSGLTILSCPNAENLGRSFLGETNVLELSIPNVMFGLNADTFAGSRVETLCGNKGSYVEQYANSNGFAFVDVNATRYPTGYVETNDVVYVLESGADLLSSENGKVVLTLPSYASNKTPVQRYAKGALYSIVGHGNAKYYVKNTDITESKPIISEDTANPNYGDFIYIEHDTYVEVTNYRGTGVDIVVPEQINGKPVLVIANTFLDGIGSDTSMMRKKVKSITANSVTTLGEGMGFWRELYSLETLVLPKVEKIWNGQFQDAVNLKHIDLSSVTYIGDWAFNSMTNCVTVIIPNVENISDNAFVGAKIKEVKGYSDSYASMWSNERNYDFVLVN